jgi:hypothetical protein
VRTFILVAAVALLGLTGCKHLSSKNRTLTCKSNHCSTTAHKPAVPVAADKSVQRKPAEQKLAIPNRLPEARHKHDLDEARRAPKLPPAEALLPAAPAEEANELPPPVPPQPLNTLPASQETPRPQLPRLAPIAPQSYLPPDAGDYTGLPPAPNVASGAPLPPLPPSVLPPAPVPPPPELLQRPVAPAPAGVVDDSAWRSVVVPSAGPPLSYQRPPAPIQQVSAVQPAASLAAPVPASSDAGRSLIGRVQQWRNTWQLRYAALDADAPYGGSVTLVGANLSQLRDGQRIRVHGSLLPPASSSQPALFQVSALEVFE